MYMLQEEQLRDSLSYRTRLYRRILSWRRIEEARKTAAIPCGRGNARGNRGNVVETRVFFALRVCSISVNVLVQYLGKSVLRMIISSRLLIDASITARDTRYVILQYREKHIICLI